MPPRDNIFPSKNTVLQIIKNAQHENEDEDEDEDSLENEELTSDFENMEQIDLLSDLDSDPEVYEELLCAEEMKDSDADEVTPLTSNAERLLINPARMEYSARRRLVYYEISSASSSDESD